MIHDMDTVRLIMDCFIPYSATGIVRAFLLANCFDTTYVFVFCVIHFYHIQESGLFIGKKKIKVIFNSIHALLVFTSTLIELV